MRNLIFAATLAIAIGPAPTSAVLADEILFPYIVRSPTVTTVVSTVSSKPSKKRTKPARIKAQSESTGK